MALGLIAVVRRQVYREARLIVVPPPLFAALIGAMSAGVVNGAVPLGRPG
jgi:hypothetical protein